MNWGWKIAIVYIAFAMMTVGFVVFGSMQKVSLVEEDYYVKEIKYQEQIDRMKNAVESPDGFSVDYNAAQYLLSLQYSGDELVTGEIHLFRPSDAKEDILLPLHPDETGLQNIDAKQLLKGLWVVKVNWTSGGKDYFKSQQINIQ